MAAHEEPKQEESIKDEPEVPDLEITAEELDQENIDQIAGGVILGP